MERVGREETGMNVNGNHHQGGNWHMEYCHFQMPLHYPKYNRADYEAMPEWKLDRLLSQYGLPVSGDVDHKRKYAMGAFLWVSP